jgi:hypothetical protein
VLSKNSIIEMLQKAKLKRRIVNRYLLGSVWPIIKATLKEPFVKRIKGKDFFSQKILYALINRVNSIIPQAQRQWETMAPDQMLHHLNLATGSALGYFDLPDESYLMSRTVSKWILVDLLSEQPKGLLLPLTFKIQPTEHFDFEYEKKFLIEIINEACNSKSTVNWGQHPLFFKKETGMLPTSYKNQFLN